MDSIGGKYLSLKIIKTQVEARRAFLYNGGKHKQTFINLHALPGGI